MKTEKLDKDRTRFAETKRLSIIKRIKCKHDYVYLGIDIHKKVFGCLKCGEIRWV